VSANRERIGIKKRERETVRIVDGGTEYTKEKERDVRELHLNLEEEHSRSRPDSTREPTMLAKEHGDARERAPSPKGTC